MEPYDLAIIGGGPAGLATASHAQANGMKYILLERTDHLADTIYNYQARKFVMAEPAVIPARSDLPFQPGSREAILDAWQRHVSDQKLNVQLKAELKTLSKAGDRFVVGTAADRSTGTAVLAYRVQGFSYSFATVWTQRVHFGTRRIRKEL